MAVPQFDPAPEGRPLGGQRDRVAVVVPRADLDLDAGIDDLHLLRRGEDGAVGGEHIAVVGHDAEPDDEPLRRELLQQVAQLDDAEASDGAGRDGQRAARLAHDPALRVADAPLDGALERLPQVVVDEDLQNAGGGIRDGRDQDRGVELAGKVVQGLPVALVVERRPAHGRPAVVELPVEGPHNVRPGAPPVLHGHLQAVALLDLAQPDPVLGIRGNGKHGCDALPDALVALGVALVVAQQRRGQVAGRLLRESLDDAGLGEARETGRAAEAVRARTTGHDGDASAPDRPEVRLVRPGIAGVRAGAWQRAAGTPGPVVAVGIQRGGQRGQQVVEEPGVVAAGHLAVRRALAGLPRPDPGVAAPECEAGVVAEPHDVVLGLGAHILQPRRIGDGIGRAGEHEILPDADPVLVAQVVEPVLLVDAAAPDAQHVHVAHADGLGQPGILDARGPRDEGVRRHPGGALGEEGQPVDNELEALAPLVVGRAIQAERAQADPPDPCVDRLAAGRAGQIHRQLVERLLAKPVRPPALGVAHLEVEARAAIVRQQRARLGDEGALVHEAGAEGQARRGVGRAHSARRHIERHAAVRAMDLPHLDRLEARILADLDADAAPDAAGDQRGGPVPAELARHLADPPATGRFASAGPVGQGVRRLVLRQVVQRRVEADSERVDVLAQPPAEIEAPAAVHVVGVPDHLAVDHHRRQRVEPVAAQHDIGLRRASGRVELPLVDPSLAADPLQIRLMVAQEGVGNEARRHQVGVDAAGHAGRHPLLLRHRAYPPAPVEVDQLHLRSYLRISRCR